MFNFGFDPEQFASLGSSFDEPDTVVSGFDGTHASAPGFVDDLHGPHAFIQRNTKSDPNETAAAKKSRLLIGTDSPSFNIADYSNKLMDEKGLYGRSEIDKKYGIRAPTDTDEGVGLADGISYEESAKILTQFDPSRGGFNPFSGGMTKDRFDIEHNVRAPLLDKMKALDFRVSKAGGVPELDTGGLAYDKDKLYINYDHRQDLDFDNDEDRAEYMAKQKTGKFYDISGGTSRLGDYSMVWVENPPDKGRLKGATNAMLNNPAMSLAASVIPFGQVALTAAKAANGQTLHGMDYLGASLDAVKSLGMLQAPVSANEARKIGELASQTGNVASGMVAEELALAGKGLTIAGKTLTYNQSVGLLSAAATGDPKSALVSIYGGDLVKGGLERAGISSEVLAKVGIPADAFESGLQKTVEKVAAGKELDEALAYGFVDYAKEGGLKNLLDMPELDISFGGIEDVVRDIVRPIGSAATALAKAVENSISGIDTSDLDPLENAIREVGRTTEDVVRAGGSAVDDAIIQPVREIAKNLDDAVIQPVREIAKNLDDAVFQPVGDALSATDTALRNAMPDIDLPSINLPNIDLPSLDMGSGMLLSGMTAPTATTGKLFENELFKFKNKIELTEFGPLNQPEQEVDIEEFLTSPFESAFTSSQRFA